MQITLDGTLKQSTQSMQLIKFSKEKPESTNADGGRDLC